MEITTVDLTSEQLKFLRTLVLSDLLGNQRLVRSQEFAKYGPVESMRVHTDITVASALIAVLPSPTPVERVTLPARFAAMGAI